MSKLVTKGPRRLVDDRWHDDNGPLPDLPSEWDPPMTDEEITAAALSDPDAQPLTEARLSRMRRVGLHGVIRRRLKLDREDFAARYHIPVETVRGWERGTVEPDAVARAFVALIAADPEGVAATLAKQLAVAAAE